jgi:large subunit ribosomal protein L20
MPRVKRGVTTHHRHKKVLELTKGHRATRHALVKRSKESMIKALSYSYAHRREKKGDMRKLWILRISAGARAQGVTYGEFMNSLKVTGIEINRKLLADMAVKEPEAFAQLVTVSKK